jgi:hypothetical protein
LIVWEWPRGCGLFLRAPNPGQLSNNTFNNTSAAFGVSSIALPPCSFGCHYFSPFPYIASETAGRFHSTQHQRNLPYFDDAENATGIICRPFRWIANLLKPFQRATTGNMKLNSMAAGRLRLNNTEKCDCFLVKNVSLRFALLVLVVWQKDVQGSGRGRVEGNQCARGRFRFLCNQLLFEALYFANALLLSDSDGDRIFASNPDIKESAL